MITRTLSNRDTMGMRFGHIATAVLFGAIVAIIIGMAWVVPKFVQGLSK